MGEDAVILESTGEAICVLRLNRPARRNAITAEMMMQLRAKIGEVASDPACRLLILTGEGPGFCAGLDLATMQRDPADPKPGAVELMALQELFAGVAPALRRLPQPVIAAISGAAVGVGFALSLAADIRIASHSSRFLIGAVKIGLSAGETGISYHLPRIIGAGRAFEIMLSGRPVDAEEALRIGLVSQLVEEGALLDAALAMGRDILANSPYSTRYTKGLMWTNLDAPSLDAAIALENHVQTVAMLTDDFDEATAAFVQKRAPQFKGC